MEPFRVLVAFVASTWINVRPQFIVGYDLVLFDWRESTGVINIFGSCEIHLISIYFLLSPILPLIELYQNCIHGTCDLYDETAFLSFAYKKSALSQEAKDSFINPSAKYSRYTSTKKDDNKPALQ